MKKVFIPMAVRKRSTDGVMMHIAREAYIQKISSYGLIPLLVPSTLPHEALDALFKESSGVLFMGGRDIDAMHYGEENHEKNSVAEPERDEVEMYILKKVLEERKPFLGICRGCQALAVASGGTLHQHTPDLGINEVHHPKRLGYIPKRHTHVITVDEHTRLASIVDARELPVHCAHHQAIKSLGDGFVASAHSSGGVIEAIEATDKSWFCFGVQFHPEVAKENPTDGIFAAFARAIL